MPRLLVFNPEHDLALAANDAHYTPPASARLMAERMQLFPRIWAQPGDRILLSTGEQVVVRNETGKDGELITSLPAGEGWEGVSPFPWGWDPLIVRRFHDAGISPALLPTSEWLDTFRNIAGRDTARIVLHRLHDSTHLQPFRNRIVGEARRCNTIDEALAATHGPTIFKQPWSGSGRGLYRFSHPRGGAGGGHLWLQRTLRRQGYVMAEPFYDKTQDFAAEFMANPDGSVTYLGLSVFKTTPSGVYSDNLIASDDKKRQHMAAFIPLELLDAAIDALKEILPSVLSPLQRLSPRFLPLGVDMMIVRGGFLHPCVEINLRMTMGHVALYAYARNARLSISRMISSGNAS